MTSRRSLALHDESSSVATLGSFGSASWVAGQIAGDVVRPEDSHEVAQPSCIRQIEDSIEYHECPVCSRLFRSMKHLREHFELTHVGSEAERNYRCPHCDKRFTRRSEMGRHVGVSFPTSSFGN